MTRQAPFTEEGVSDEEGGAMPAPGTPLPWSQYGEVVKSTRDLREGGRITEWVCRALASDSLSHCDGNAKRERDIRYIVTACNAFPEMLEALDYARAALGTPVPVSKRHVARKIDAAIAKARGQ